MRPRWAELILSGEKTVELRRRPPAAAGAVLLVYATAPVRAVVAIARVEELQLGAAAKLWQRVGAASRVPRAEFERYLHGATCPGALVLRDVQPVVAIAPGFSAPQSWQWLRPEREDHRRLFAAAVASASETAGNVSTDMWNVVPACHTDLVSAVVRS